MFKTIFIVPINDFNNNYYNDNLICNYYTSLILYKRNNILFQTK